MLYCCRAVYFDSHVYRARMRLVIAPFLCYADEEVEPLYEYMHTHDMYIACIFFLVFKYACSTGIHCQHGILSTRYTTIFTLTSPI